MKAAVSLCFLNTDGPCLLVVHVRLSVVRRWSASGRRCVREAVKADNTITTSVVTEHWRPAPRLPPQDNTLSSVNTACMISCQLNCLCVETRGGDAIVWTPHRAALNSGHMQ